MYQCPNELITYIWDQGSICPMPTETDKCVWPKIICMLSLTKTQYICISNYNQLIFHNDDNSQA